MPRHGHGYGYGYGHGHGHRHGHSSLRQWLMLRALLVLAALSAFTALRKTRHRPAGLTFPMRRAYVRQCLNVNRQSRGRPMR
jgi:hypothetical protein